MSGNYEAYLLFIQEQFVSKGRPVPRGLSFDKWMRTSDAPVVYLKKALERAQQEQQR